MKTKMVIFAIFYIITGIACIILGIAMLRNKPKKPVYSKEYGCIGLTTEQCAKLSLHDKQARQGYQKSWEDFHRTSTVLDSSVVDKWRTLYRDVSPDNHPVNRDSQNPSTESQN